jgi:micrococcal nuclease
MSRNRAIRRWILYSIYVLGIVFLVFFLYPPFRGIRVEEVADGDTIVLSDGRAVRYIGIDTPEEGETLFAEAKKVNQEMLRGKKITLEYDIEKQDRYRRALAYVWIDSLLVNAELIRRGLAKVYLFSPNLKYRDLFIRLQKEARANNLGLWSVEVSPEEYYLASRKSKRFVFHRPGCEWAKRIRPGNLLRFEARDEALDSGYSPCRTCKP